MRTFKSTYCIRRAPKAQTNVRLKALQHTCIIPFHVRHCIIINVTNKLLCLAIYYFISVYWYVCTWRYQAIFLRFVSPKFANQSTMTNVSFLFQLLFCSFVFMTQHKVRTSYTKHMTYYLHSIDPIYVQRADKISLNQGGILVLARS